VSATGPTKEQIAGSPRLRKNVEIPNAAVFVFGGGTVFACAAGGNVDPDAIHGLFAADTRVLSRFRVTLDGEPLDLLGRSRSDNSTASWEFQNSEIPGKVREGAVLVTMTCEVDRALHQHLRVRSYLNRKASVRLAIELDADFADMFEVLQDGAVPRTVKREARKSELRLSYERGDFRRAMTIDVRADSPLEHEQSGIAFDLALTQGFDWSCCIVATPSCDGEELQFPISPHSSRSEDGDNKRHCSILGNSTLALAFERGRSDLESLAMEHKHGPPFVGAGIPQFLAVFGRDALMAGVMSTIAAPWATEGALDVLAELQATEHDPWRDAQPGKFPHELRRGEQAWFKEIPHHPYYGAHDVPALYCIALWEAWRWSGRRDLLEKYLQVAEAALHWCDTLGDQDGDGLLEYGTRSSDGYFNQGWKDAEDGIPDKHGDRPLLPLATVELQGYLFAARLAMAELYDASGRGEDAQRLRLAAEHLRGLVEDRFWLPEKQFYAIALDGNKDQLASLSSNPGHLLWCGLPSPERAQALATRFVSEEFYTGWGLRTLSSEHPGYNPLSYQRGSVWPHDTMLAAAGLWRYGLREPALVLIRGLVDAVGSFEQYRLPELFSGAERTNGFPIPYKEANVPQAWGASVPLLATQLMLGIVPDAPNGRCYVEPSLPEWLPGLEVENVRVGEGRFSIKVSRCGDATVIDRIDACGIEVVERDVEAPLWGRPTRSESALEATGA
jgi:glycogen debranching enzyme